MTANSIKIIMVSVIVVIIGVAGGVMLTLNETSIGSTMPQNTVDDTNQQSISKIISTQAQRTPLSFESLVMFSDVILIGTISDKQIDLHETVQTIDPINRGPELEGKILQRSYSIPFQSITVDVEEYLKDDSGNHSPKFVFKDFVSGEGKLDGEKILVESADEGNHEIGDYALFFISDSDYGWVSYEFGQKFPIDENNKVQIPIFYDKKEFVMPTDLEPTKTKIKTTLQVIDTVRELLESDESQKKIRAITQQINEKEIPLNEKNVKRILEIKLIEEQLSEKSLELDVTVLVDYIEKNVTIPRLSTDEFHSDVTVVPGSRTQ